MMNFDYNVDYEVCALLFLILIAIRYFEIKFFPNLKNRLFGVVIAVGLVDLTFDILSSLIADNIITYPEWVSYSAITFFYMLQMFFPYIALLYMYTLAYPQGYPRKKIILYSIPMLVFIIGLFANLYNGKIFYVDYTLPDPVFSHGDLFFLLYVEAIGYIIATLISVCINKKYMRKKEFTQSLYCLSIVVLSIVVQYFNPDVLLTGVAISVAITMVFFTMQNPNEMIDVTTGVFNYAALLLFLRDSIGDKNKFHLIAVDIEGIRRINGLFGLETGNQIIGDIGKFLKELSEESFVFRMIGTRFSIVVYSESEVIRIMDALEEKFLHPWKAKGIDLTIKAVLRYFRNSNEFDSPQSLINFIDISYSDTINFDKNKSLEINTELIELIQHRLDVEDALRRGVENDEGFEIYLQPLFSLNEQKFLSAEVLLRFFDDDLGFIPPSEFIPIAEKIGLIFKLDEMVVRKTYELISSSGFMKKYDVRSLEINLSAAEFSRQNFPEMIISITSQYNIDPSVIVFEVTETVASKSSDVLKEYMNELRSFGFKFALDDYGTGYANIVQVTKLPFSIVKIDRTILLDDEKRNNASIVFEYTMEMLRALGLKTVVEGVETDKQIQRSAYLKADFIQGFYYAKPMNVSDYLSFLEQNNNPI